MNDRKRRTSSNVDNIFGHFILAVLFLYDGLVAMYKLITNDSQQNTKSKRPESELLELALSKKSNQEVVEIITEINQNGLVRN